MDKRIYPLLPLFALACGVPTVEGGGVDPDYVEGIVAELDEHVADPEAHHETPAPGSPTTDAGDLTEGVLDPARLPEEVVMEWELPDQGLQRSVGYQQPDFNDSVTLSSTSFVELGSVTPTGPRDTNVALSAHVYLERTASATGRYLIAIAAGGCDGTVVGATMWRPPTSGDTWIADTLSLTGYAEAVPLGTTFVLCGRKYDGSAPDASANYRGLVATW